MWSNLSLTSKNLAHRLIHFKVIHRAYITRYKRFKMKLQSNLNCHICNTTSSGTFLHMFWECPVVISLWTHVNLVLSSLLRIDWSVNPSLCLLFFVINNFYFLFFHTQHNRISKIKQNKTADTYSTSQGSIKREGEREGQQEHKSHSFK